MKARDVEVPHLTEGTASDCLKHAITTFGRDALKAALLDFVTVDAGAVGIWFAGDIRWRSKYTPILYVALDLMGYGVLEMDALDDKRRAILRAYAFGGLTDEDIIDELRVGQWSDAARVLLNVNQTGREALLQELADDVHRDVKAEVPLQADRLMLHVMLLHAQGRLRNGQRPRPAPKPQETSHTTRPSMATEPSPITSTASATQADDPRFATAVARQIETLLVMLSMQPDRHQLLVRSRLGKNLQDLVQLLQEALAPPVESNATIATKEVTQS